MDNVPVPVVGIGASAGGIDAFRRFFEKMPGDSGFAFVVVLHLAADRKSMLPEILARWTSMEVREARDGSVTTANEVLVIPGGVVAKLTNGRLALRQIPPNAPRETAPIDAFFDSLARSLGENAIAIILSGTGHDGALGLKAIKTQGGLTLAQGVDGSAPEFSGMPNSAVAAGAVDLLVPVEEMPGHILNARKAQEAPTPDTETPEAGEIQRAMCDIIRSRLGHDFGQYKNQTFMRRVQRRMQALQLTSYSAYLNVLEADREQVVLLFRDLLIGVTSFFRDADAFAVIKQQVIPRLFEGKDASSELRVWVAGCATGEEAYSLAILLREHMDTLTTTPKVSVFASDLDEVAVATARAGRYPASLLEGMSDDRRTRFFIEGATGYLVRQEVRELCTFSTHSLVRDPPFSRVDFISCRNLLIYLDNDLQDRVIPVFHYALVPGGVLMLGISESISRHERLFAPLDAAHRVFIRRAGASEAPGLPFVSNYDRTLARGFRPSAKVDPKSHWSLTIGYANQRILERFSSAFVVAQANGDIVHFSNHTGRFLEPAHGAPAANLFDMARYGWGLDLRATLRRCIETGRPIEQERSLVTAEGEPATPVKLLIEPLPSPHGEPLYLVVFVEIEPQPGAGYPDDAAIVLEPNGLVVQLERENRNLREQLQSVVEEHSTALEELRSSNEELQSVNEELQSTNEELETSREEIQSINEELNTVIGELSSKVEQLARSNGDLKNLFDSTRVATLFLDPFLIIRSFTPEIASIYNLIPSDLGRPLTDIVSRLDYPALPDDVHTVLHSLKPLEKRVERRDGSAHYLMRILPYRTPDSGIDGSLITFVDVTSIVRAEEHQRLLVDELNHRVKNMLTVVVSLATNTVTRSPSLEQFLPVFLGRIHALTAAYALLSRDGWAPISIREIVMEELKPFISNEQVNLTLTGDLVLLPPRTALALGMTVHELTTNAVKYGALSVPVGTVAIGWGTEATPKGKRLVFHWIEQGGPAVSRPSRRGFGMTLIERGFPYDVSGEVKLDFAPSGVTATLYAPLGGSAAEDAAAGELLIEGMTS